MFIGNRMNKVWYIPTNGILQNSVNQITTTCCDLGESYKHNVEKKNQTQKTTYYVILFL